MPQNSILIHLFFLFYCFHHDVLCKIPTWADGTDLYLSCDKPSGFSQQVEIGYELQYQKYQKMQFCIQLYIDVLEINLYLQANPYRLKAKNINSLICIFDHHYWITNVNMFLFYRLCFSSERILTFFSTELYWHSSPQSCCFK